MNMHIGAAIGRLRRPGARGRTPRRAVPFLAAVAAGLGVVPGTAAAAPAPVSEPSCVSPAAADGHEPRCNPHLAQSHWAGAHRGSYAQASSPFPGPKPGQDVKHSHTSVSGVPIALAFSEPYADGGRAVWGSLVSAPENQGVFKLDEATGEVIDVHTDPTGELTSDSTGAYNVLDRDNHLIVAHRKTLDVYGDSVPGDRSSPIARLASLDLAAVMCREDDRVVGITMGYDGKVAFATALGVVGVVPRQVEQMNSQNLRTVSLNADACDDPSVERDDLEQVSNSISADESGGVYVVTSKAQYRFSAHRTPSGAATFARDWRAEYETGGIVGGARLGSGSGSTPSLMGTERDDDKFVVITDGQQLMNLVVMWRDEIPKDWEPIAPGKDRRIACEVPVTFGDDRTESVSEQSVLVRGNAAVVVDNAHTLDPAFSALPQELRPFSVIGGQLDANAPHGIQRIDWNPQTRTCETKWANPEVSMPNGIPTMSVPSGLIYDIGQQDGQWGLSAVDFASGEQKMFVPSGFELDKNSFFAGSEIGPDGSVWTGTLQGVSAFRPTR